jgi:Plasmid pRiA4b ORF-3-like protein
MPLRSANCSTPASANPKSLGAFKWAATPDPMEKAFGGSRTASERTARLFNALGSAGIKAVYTYDFGDSWEHRIVVEKRLAQEPGHAYPACLAGERHAPPEDCGGIPGLYNLLEAIRDPKHEEHEELRTGSAGGSIRMLSRSTRSTVD